MSTFTTQVISVGSCAMLFVQTDRIYFAEDTLSVPFCAHVINLKRRKRYGRAGLKMSLLPMQAIYCMHAQGTPLKTTRLPTALHPTSRCMHGDSLGCNTQLGHNGVPSLAPYNQQVYAKEECALFGAMHCYLSFGHQSAPCLVEQNQQVYAEGECITPRCSQSCDQPAGECKGTVEVVHNNVLLPLLTP